MATHKPKSQFEQLTEQLGRYPSLDKLHVQRNLALGAAAASLIILIELVSAGVNSSALKVSLFACAVSIPSWVGLAGLVEYYIVLGPKTYGHRGSEFAQAVAAMLFLPGGFGLLAAVAGLLYHLEPDAAYVFGAAVVFVLVVSIAFHGHLASWYKSKGVSQPPGGDT